MQRIARAYDIDPDLIHAVVDVESAGRAEAVSPKGARGLMQVMPATARRFGAASAEALTDPLVNLRVGAAYLKALQGRFGNNLPLVLAAYNAGEGAVARYGAAIPPYRETRTYVTRVLALYAEALSGRAGR